MQGFEHREIQKFKNFWGTYSPLKDGFATEGHFIECLFSWTGVEVQELEGFGPGGQRGTTP